MTRLLHILLLFVCLKTFAQNTENKQLKRATDLLFSDPEKSAKISEKAFAEAKNYNEKIKALSKLVNAQMVLGDISQVINNSSLGIKLSKEKNDTINQIRFLSMLGNQYQQLNMNTDAKKNLDEAENLINIVHLPQNLLFISGNVYNVKGIVFKNELNCEFAVKYFNKALEVYNKLPYEEVVVTNKLLIDIQKAVCLEALGNSKEAESIYKSILERDVRGIGYNKYYASLGLADIYLKRKEIDNADKMLQSVNINEFKQYDAELTSLFYKLKAQSSYLKNDSKSYLYYFEKYNENYREISQSQNQIISRLENIYDTNLSENSSSIWMRNLSLLSIFLIIFVSVVVFFHHKLKKDGII
ncbi:tetratricopeptide repeat protein [Epilithonimonas zeae]|uniref:tetratricopeptide repeat protein n=1 Tax=Epilithonimonas zeae TaxID=1416779 RepID=UPI00200D6996|nr:hypothetical protein [Epilithonimonas zeae]UQB69358.1 hypothetical protein KI430_02705 [Epilithonimonas zeae]